jgi:UDP-N-acetylmuramyl pentapeptide synthase
MRVLPGIKGSVIIDDTYNSSPVAAEHAIETVAMIKHAKRRIAVMGDMLELGKFSSDEHKRIGAHIAEHFDMLLTVGVRARGFAEGALTHGMDESAIFQYEQVGRAGRELQAMLQPGDVVLIKASQGIRAERIVEEIMLEPERATELLVRQDPIWKTKGQIA